MVVLLRFVIIYRQLLVNSHSDLKIFKTDNGGGEADFLLDFLKNHSQ